MRGIFNVWSWEKMVQFYNSPKFGVGMSVWS
jgi:hypothetical protein